MGKLLSQGWLAYQRRIPADDRSEEIGRGLGATKVNLIGYVAQTTIRMSELLNLQPGDILKTTKPANGEMIIQVQGLNKFAGKLGKHKDNLALKITRRAEIEEPL